MYLVEKQVSGNQWEEFNRMANLDAAKNFANSYKIDFGGVFRVVDFYTRQTIYTTYDAI